jgi:hypothetical protein
MNDPWTNEDDDANATPSAGEVEATAAPEVQKPDVAADPAIPTLVLPKPQIEATAAAPETKTEPEEKSGKAEFPSNYGECLNIAASMRGVARLGDNPTPNQKAAHKKFLRLQAHIHRIQQGTPTIHVDSRHAAAFIGIQNAGLSETKLRYLARSNREVKQLLEKFEQACEANETLLAENNSLREQIAKLTKK